MNSSSRVIATFTVVVALAFGHAACSGTSSGTGASGTCAQDYGGAWALSGSCNESDCQATQTGCNLAVTCTGGTKLSGSVSGTSVSLAGTASDGAGLDCAATLSGKSINLSCSTSGTTCSLTGSCATCGASSSSGTSGTSGSSGSSGVVGGSPGYLCWLSAARCDCRPVSQIPAGGTAVTNCTTTPSRRYCCQFAERCGCDDVPGCGSGGATVDACENKY